LVPVAGQGRQFYSCTQLIRTGPVHISSSSAVNDRKVQNYLSPWISIIITITTVGVTVRVSSVKACESWGGECICCDSNSLNQFKK
jgi:hypothetical protein